MDLAKHYGVVGLKESTTIRMIMTKLAAEIYPDDTAFQQQVDETWSRQGPSVQAKRDYKSDLGNEVDECVMGFVEPDEQREFKQVEEAAQRRKHLAKQKLHDEIVEAKAKWAPKPKKKAANAKAKAKAKAEATAKNKQQRSKGKQSEKKDRSQKKRKLRLGGAEIAKRAKRLAITDYAAIEDEQVHDDFAMQQQIVPAVTGDEPELLPPANEGTLPPEQPVSQSQVPNSTEPSHDGTQPVQVSQGLVPNSNEPSNDALGEESLTKKNKSKIDDATTLFDLLQHDADHPEHASSSSSSRPAPSSSRTAPAAESASQPPELRKPKEQKPTEGSSKLSRGPISESKGTIPWETLKCDKCGGDAGQFKLDPSPGSRDKATYYYRAHEKKKGALTIIQ